jgi:hypothetical protein
MNKLLVALGVLALLGVAGLLMLALALHGVPHEALHISVNDREIHLVDLSHWQVVSGGFGLLLGLAALAIAVPLVLLLGVLLPVLLVVGAVLLVVGLALGVGVLGMAPLLLPLLLLFWLWRRAQRRAARAERAAQAAQSAQTRSDASNTINL